MTDQGMSHFCEPITTPGPLLAVLTCPFEREISPEVFFSWQQKRYCLEGPSHLMWNSAMEREDLHEIFERIQSGIVIIDPEDHTIIDINPNALSLIGRGRDEVLGRICHQHICPAQKGKCPITDLGQGIDNSERVLINRDGHKIPILKTATRATLGKKEVIIESFIDNRDRKIAEERRCALIGYIDETVLRIREPLVMVQHNLADIAARAATRAMDQENIGEELQAEVARLGQIIGNLREVQQAIVEERHEIPEAFRAFIAGA